MHQLRFERPESQNLRRVRTRHSSSVYANARRPAWPTGPWRGGFVADRLPPADSYAETRTRPGERARRRRSKPRSPTSNAVSPASSSTSKPTTPLLRSDGRVGQRVAELEDAIAERRARVGDRGAHVGRRRPVARPPADLADRLAEAPQGELRALFDALQLDVVYQPADDAVDVAPHPCDTLIFLTKRFVVAAAMALWFDRPAAHPRGWCRGHRHRSLFHAGHVLRLGTLPTLPCWSTETLARGRRSGR